MSSRETRKVDFIRKMLLKTVGKNPELFSYYVSIMEAKELLGKPDSNMSLSNAVDRLAKKLADG